MEAPESKERAIRAQRIDTGGPPCNEAQADGVPCEEIGADCEDCERAEPEAREIYKARRSEE